MVAAGEAEKADVLKLRFSRNAFPPRSVSLENRPSRKNYGFELLSWRYVIGIHCGATQERMNVRGSWGDDNSVLFVRLTAR